MGDVREFSSRREIRISARDLDTDDIEKLDPIMERIEDALREARNEIFKKSSQKSAIIIRVLPK